MSVATIERHEVIDINERDGQRLTGTRCAPVFHFEHLVKSMPVGHARQSILRAECLQALHSKVQFVGSL
jgi:hypothetical protein